MSCHYSCVGCSEPTYFDSCLSCPSTRQLQSGVCSCLSGFREILSVDCVQFSENAYDITVKVLYYFSMVMSLVVVLAQMTRYRLPLTKKLIDTNQAIALCVYFRWKYTTLSTSAFSVMDNYNFVFANFYCNKSQPPLYCTGFENLIAPTVVVGFFLVLYFIAYSILYFRYALCEFRHPEVLTFKSFHRQNFQNVLAVYLNATIILNTLAFARLSYYSMWALFLIGGHVVALMFYFRAFYRIVNNPDEQPKLLYRTQYCLLFLYDQNYHNNYIDHLYEQVEFRVRSNFLVLELLFKLLWAGSLIVNYKYKPGLVAYILVLLLWIAMFRIRVFFKYENLKLLAYLLLDFVFLMAVTVFWMSQFEGVVFYSTCVLQGLLVIAFLAELILNRFQMKVENRIFSELSQRSNPTEQLDPQLPKVGSDRSNPDKTKNVFDRTNNNLLLADV